MVSKEILSQRTADYQNWVEAFARNHHTPIAWAEKGVRKEDHVLPWQRRMTRNNAHGVYYIFKSIEQGPTFRISMPKYPTKDRTTASLPTSAAASRTITSTSATKFSAPW